jgi:NitT/TauT family transport system substrate-binding protein
MHVGASGSRARELTRRSFVIGLGVSFAGGLLGACTSSQPEVGRAPTASVAVSGQAAAASAASSTSVATAAPLVINSSTPGVTATAPRPSATATPAPTLTSTPSPAESGRLDVVRCVSPRGALEVVDDYPHSIGLKFDWFRQQGIDARFEPGPLEPTATTKQVAGGQSDVGFPSPGLLALSLDAGTPLLSVFEMSPRDVFCFSVRPDDQRITSVKDLKDRSIALGSAEWRAIADPLLKGAGVDPSGVKYVDAGALWGQTVAEGKVDAALTWQGLLAQWEGSGLKLRHIEGKEFSPFPSNSYVIRRAEWSDPKRRDVYVRFLKVVAMGMQWGHLNPRGAAQLSLERFPALDSQMTPEVATAAVAQLATVFHNLETDQRGWGWHPIAGWTKYFQTLRELGQITRDITVDDVVKNDWVPDVNAYDKILVARTAKEFKLSPELEKVHDPGLV